VRHQDVQAVNAAKRILHQFSRERCEEIAALTKTEQDGCLCCRLQQLAV
jgi:hypothetical protein